MHPFLGVFGASYNSVQRTNTTVSNTTLTVAGTAHTWSTPVQLVASTPFDTVGFMLRVGITATSGARSDTLLRLMVGGAGAETPVVGGFSFGNRQTGSTLTLPLFIPAGSRLSVAAKMARTTPNLSIALDLYGGPNRDGVGLPTRWVAYGLTDDASNSRGTIVAPGATNTWGSWTALTTSTTYAHDLWVPMIDGGSATAITAVNYRSQFAIASTTDAATMVTNATVWDGPGALGTTAEQLLDNYFGAGAASTPMHSGAPFTPGGIIYAPRAAGAAVSARAMCSGTPDTNGFGCSILAAL